MVGVIIDGDLFFRRLKWIESSVRVMAGRMDKGNYFRSKQDLKDILEQVEALESLYCGKVQVNREELKPLKLVEN